MRISEVARRAQVTPKAVRYYEELGLLRPARTANGYRHYTSDDLRVVVEIRELAASGLGPSRSRPFVECLNTGHDHSDECPSSLVAYRDRITELDRMITLLTARRDQLARRLDEGTARAFTSEHTMTDYTTLPADLPEPSDDGAADHLPGLALPEITLPATDGREVRLDRLGSGRTVLYLYPLTGRPGQDLPDGQDAIPGARGCSSEACDFRDHHDDLRDAGAMQVFGLSSQDTAYQAEVVHRLHLPFPMLSDAQFLAADRLQLPTFNAPGHERLYTRLTLVITDGVIEHAFYPVFPPNAHAHQVLDWLSAT